MMFPFEAIDLRVGTSICSIMPVMVPSALASLLKLLLDARLISPGFFLMDFMHVPAYEVSTFTSWSFSAYAAEKSDEVPEEEYGYESAPTLVLQAAKSVN